MPQSLPSHGLNAQQRGVTGDGVTDDAPAIQALLDRRAPLIYFPPGHYRIGHSLRLPCHTRIQAHPFAWFRLADGAGKDVHTFLISNADLDNGNESISIRGGIWDGNCAANPRTDEEDRQGYTGALANFRRVRGLSLVDMTLRDSTAYYTRLSAVRDFRVERIRFEASLLTNNQDGVHVAGQCEDGLIRDIQAVGRACTGDDLVALNADDALDRSETRGKLGGPIRRLRIHGLRADDCHSFVRMAAVWSEIEDIEVHDLRGGCRVNVLNADGLRFCASPLFRRDDPRYAGGVGLLRRIRLRDVTAWKSGRDSSPLLRLHERMIDLEVENLTRLRSRDAAPNAPTIDIAYQTTEGIVLEGITGDEAEACKAQSQCTQLDLSRLPCAAGETRDLRIDAAVEVSGRFASSCDRFDRLRVECSHLDPLPPPDWTVRKGQYAT